eukprot:162922_1
MCGEDIAHIIDRRQSIDSIDLRNDADTLKIRKENFELAKQYIEQWSNCICSSPSSSLKEKIEAAFDRCNIECTNKRSHTKDIIIDEEDDKMTEIDVVESKGDANNKKKVLINSNG